MAYAVFEDVTLRKVFAVALDPAAANPSASPPVVHLPELEQELRAESGAAAPLLSADTLDRAVVARLSTPPASYPQWPVHYLIGCYSRALEEARGAAQLKEAADRERLAAALALARQLAVSYAGALLAYGIFPQPEAAEARGALQLLDAMFASAAAADAGLGFAPPPLAGTAPLIPEAVSAATQVVPMPQAFLEEFAAKHAEEGLTEALGAIVPALMKRLGGVSVLGDFGAPLGVLERLVAVKPAAAALAALPTWLPRAGADGRAVEFQTLLGTAFGISAIPDIAGLATPAAARQPDVVAQCFPDLDNPPRDLRSSLASIHAGATTLRAQLHRIMMALLRAGGPVRDAALGWLSAALLTNQERAKMQPNLKKAATDGFMLNVAAVLLKMAEPFADPAAGKAWPRLDPRYPSDPAARGRCFDDDTRLGATTSEATSWASGAAAAAPPADYHFICECFFMTAAALRLGFAKGLENMNNAARTAQYYAEDAEGTPGAQGAALRAAAGRVKGIVFAMEQSFFQDALVADVLGFYRLLTAWMLRLASPAAATGGPPALPLPAPAPPEFAALPEFYVENVCDALTAVGRFRPDALAAPAVASYMIFFTVFLGSPAHVKNPYLRGKMVEALASLLPPGDGDGDGWRPPRRRAGAAAEEAAFLFQADPLVTAHMVRSLIALFVDIERTDRSNAFYEKFNMRYQCGEVMAYLWNLPPHRAAWRAVAADDPKLYVRFVNFILTDSQHLLQEALEALPAVQEIERAQGDGAGWAALGQAARAERLQALESHRSRLRSDFALAEIYLRTARLTSEDPATAVRFFDVEVRDRQARILDFFLRYLTLPAERRRLKLKDPEKCGWRPRELIASLAAIHVNLFRRDREAWAAAVAADTDYYGRNPEVFDELAGVLEGLGLAAPDAVADVRALAAAAAAAAAAAGAEEDAFDEVPEELECPLTAVLMRDPVLLPTSKTVVDRSSILHQLLNNPVDPFNRQPLAEGDLVECPELKAKAEAWVAGQRAKRRGGGSGGGEGDGQGQGQGQGQGAAPMEADQ